MVLGGHSEMLAYVVTSSIETRVRTISPTLYHRLPEKKAFFVFEDVHSTTVIHVQPGARATSRALHSAYI